MSKAYNNCPKCTKVFDGLIGKVRQLHDDIQRIKGLSEASYSNLTHTQQKLGMFLNDAIDDHHYLLLHKYDRRGASS